MALQAVQAVQASLLLLPSEEPCLRLMPLLLLLLLLLLSAVVSPFWSLFSLPFSFQIEVGGIFLGVDTIIKTLCQACFWEDNIFDFYTSRVWDTLYANIFKQEFQKFQNF